MAPKQVRLISTFVGALIFALGKCSSFSSPLDSSPISGRKGNLIRLPPFGIHLGSCRRLPSASIHEATRSTGTWVDRLHELEEYREKHGSTMVPKRYPENPSLGNWVNKQRVMYRRYCANEKPCSLTAEKVEVLNQVGFCWDGIVGKKENTFQDAERRWWQQLEVFKQLHMTSSKESIKFPLSFDRWMRQQRAEYEKYRNGDVTCKLDEKKIAALIETDANWWKTSRQRKWEERCLELIAYRDEHGDCCVPISYSKNKKLGNWVSNCRKNYKVRMAGEYSSLSLERIEQLTEIGMVWDRWEFEYEEKASASSSRGTI